MASAITIFEDGTVSTVNVNRGNALHFARMLTGVQDRLLEFHQTPEEEPEEEGGPEGDDGIPSGGDEEVA